MPFRRRGMRIVLLKPAMLVICLRSATHRSMVVTKANQRYPTPSILESEGISVLFCLHYSDYKLVILWPRFNLGVMNATWIVREFPNGFHYLSIWNYLYMWIRLHTAACEQWTAVASIFEHMLSNLLYHVLCRDIHRSNDWTSYIISGLIPLWSFSSG